MYKIGIIYEHQQWHEPLFEELERKNISFQKINLNEGFCSIDDIPNASLYYNLVSPSAYIRGNQKAIPFARAICTYLEMNGKKVLNGSSSIDLEMSKSSQMMLLKSINVNHPRTHFFNSLSALEKNLNKIIFPQILKPQQGGSGSRIYKVHSYAEIQEIFASTPNIWEPDYLFLLQDEIDYDKEFGIIRLEFLGNNLLYAMRVVTNGSFNLCPSIICNPENGESGHCEIPQGKAPEFYAYNELSDKVLADAKSVIRASGHNIASVEFAIDKLGNAIFYDINSNSNLRANISEEYGSGNPFAAVVDYLLSQIPNEEKTLEDFALCWDLDFVVLNKQKNYYIK